MVQAGKIGITIMPHGDLEMLMTISASDAGDLRTDMPVRIKMDALDFQDYGTVAGNIRLISSDSQITKEPTASAQAVYSIRVKLDQQSLSGKGVVVPLKLGMTGLGEVITERASLLTLLLRKVKHTISL